MLTSIVGVIGLAGLVALGQQDRGDAGSQGSMRAYRPEVPGTRALATSAHPLASMAGMQVLMSGGNAADAAVAIAATLNVVEPQSSGMGGNGFATYFDKPSGQVYSLSMAGAAPSGIEPAEMTAETLNQGIKAAIVPGNLGGLISLLERYGTRTLGEVLAPAIRYAEEGHPIHQGLASGLKDCQYTSRQHPSCQHPLRMVAGPALSQCSFEKAHVIAPVSLTVRDRMTVLRIHTPRVRRFRYTLARSRLSSVTFSRSTGVGVGASSADGVGLAVENCRRDTGGGGGVGHVSAASSTTSLGVSRAPRRSVWPPAPRAGMNSHSPGSGL